MSRCHPGQSTSYRRKVERRKEREPDRERLRLAKEMHQRNFPGRVELDRVKIRRYKKIFKKLIAEGKLSRDKEGKFMLPKTNTGLPAGLLS